MLIHDFICLDRPLAELDAQLRQGDDWLADPARRATDDGEALLVRAGPSGILSKQVRITVGEPRMRGDAVILPIHWEATGLTRVFPALDADLEFAPLGEGTQISLWGTYDPPLDGVGSRLDRLVFHRIAEATIRSFLGRVAQTLGGADTDPPVRPRQDSNLRPSA